MKKKSAQLRRQPAAASRCPNTLLADSPFGVILVASNGKILFANPRFSKLSGIPHAQLHGRRLADGLLEPDQPMIFRRLWDCLQSGKPFQGEESLRVANSHSQWICLTIQPLRTRKPHQVVGYLEDITAWKQSVETIEHMTLHDLLTGLPNRDLFNRQLNQELERIKHSGHKLALVLLDLDRFKLVNTTLDHTVGDELIKHVALRLRQHLQPADLLARMGGDEFIVLLPEVANFQDAFHRVQGLMAAFAAPFECNGHELHINVSIGISIFPEDGQTSQDLLKNADSALYEAKDTGRNHYKFYTPNLNAHALEQLSKEAAIRHALERNEFEVFYQPQVSLVTGRITGLEALVRWRHPEIGLIMPDQFIALSEENGLIVNLGKWVLKSACLQTAAWHQTGYPDLRISVNLSARQFQEPELVEMILGICQETGLNPHFLELEITESLLMKDLSVTGMILKWLNKKGIRLAIDDFGTGYSSLAYLKRFPIHTLKIDRSFIRDCLTNPDDAAIVSSMTSIANNLGLNLVAEGVEDENQLRFLSQLGCQCIQGHFFSMPCPAAEITALLARGPLYPPSPAITFLEPDPTKR